MAHHKVMGKCIQPASVFFIKKIYSKFSSYSSFFNDMWRKKLCSCNVNDLTTDGFENAILEYVMFLTVSSTLLYYMFRLYTPGLNTKTIYKKTQMKVYALTKDTT